MNGYTTLTPTEVLIGPAVVYRGGVPWAVSRGGVRVEPFNEIRSVEFDGRRAAVAGLDRIVSYGIRVTGTFLEYSVAQAQRYELGVTGVVAPVGVTTITPREADVFLPAGAYVGDLVCVVKRADNTLVGVRIPKALVTYSIAGEDRGEAGIDTQFEARLDVGAGGLGTEDAPYTIEFDTSGTVVGGGESDVHLALIEALGGDSVVDAFFVTTDGITGLADDSVEHSGGMVDEWNDYRGAGFAPLLAGVGTTRPAWAFPEIIGDGVDDFMLTALDARFAADGPKSLIVVGAAATADQYVAAIASSSAAERLMGIDTSAGGGSVIRMRAFPGGENVPSLVANGAVRRVMFAGHNGTTTGSVQVASQAEVTGAITEIPAGDNYLAMFGYGPTGGKSASRIVALIVLNRKFTAGDVALITAWAVANLTAVEA